MKSGKGFVFHPMHAPWLWGVVLFFAVVFHWSQVGAATDALVTPMAGSQNDKVASHDISIEQMRSEIQTLQYNLDWLQCKILRRETAGQPVSHRLYQSVEFKKTRMAALETAISHLEAIKKKEALKAPPMPEPIPVVAPPVKVEAVPTDVVAKPEPKAEPSKVNPSADKAEEKMAKPIPAPKKMDKAAKPAEKMKPCQVAACPKKKQQAMKERCRKKKAMMAARIKTVKEEIHGAGLDQWMTVGMGRRGLEIRTMLPILFPSGSAQIAASYDPFLKDLAKFIQARPFHVYVNGFADIDPIKTKTYPSNLELGSARAAAVVHALIGAGAPKDSFKITSTGDHRFPGDRTMGPVKEMERYVTIFLRPGAPVPCKPDKKAKLQPTLIH